MEDAAAWMTELAEQLKRGDRRALAPLVERHYDALVGYAYRLTYGDRALARGSR